MVKAFDTAYASLESLPSRSCLVSSTVLLGVVDQSVPSRPGITYMVTYTFESSLCFMVLLYRSTGRRIYATTNPNSHGRPRNMAPHVFLR